MNLSIEWKLYGILERAETKEVMYFASEWYKKRLAQNGAESIPIEKPMSCFKMFLPTVK